MVQQRNDYRLCPLQPPAPVPKKTVRQKSAVTREKSLDLPDRHRQEARRRLMAAKRAASFRQDSASERADSIEIYIPEAQTRLWDNEGSGTYMSPCSYNFQTSLFSRLLLSLLLFCSFLAWWSPSSALIAIITGQQDVPKLSLHHQKCSTQTSWVYSFVWVCWW